MLNVVSARPGFAGALLHVPGESVQAIIAITDHSATAARLLRKPTERRLRNTCAGRSVSLRALHYV